MVYREELRETACIEKNQRFKVRHRICSAIVTKASPHFVSRIPLQLFMAKIFIGIALVLTLFTAVLGFLTKGKIEGLKEERKDAVTAKNKAEGNLQVAKTELKKAQEDVTAAKTAVEEKDKEVTSKTAQIDTLTKQLADAKTASDDKDTKIADLTAKLAGAKPEPTVPTVDPAVLAETQKRAEKAEAELAEAKKLEQTMNRKVK